MSYYEGEVGIEIGIKGTGEQSVLSVKKEVTETWQQMEKWSWWWCKCKNTFINPAKRLMFGITSRLTQNTRGRRDVLVTLYKDMESCRGYGDIQVMWEMLHSPPNSHYNINRRRNGFSYRRFCFKPDRS